MVFFRLSQKLEYYWYELPSRACSEEEEAIRVAFALQIWNEESVHEPNHYEDEATTTILEMAYGYSGLGQRVRLINYFATANCQQFISGHPIPAHLTSNSSYLAHFLPPPTALTRELTS
ncbi:hypothetical protein MSG28_015861 [Choristoneura fumiferana]|uniref:Uncharacterized protein n=1 Tax=Choristoneura fumiferana TaxID=7141 RepID=A0ACC0K4J8_CHOFU|nr:hypothetical protein MSG28_015861 [Choristoneura fumiferana]